MENENPQIDLASPQPSNTPDKGIAKAIHNGEAQSSSPNHEIFDQTERDSKLELYEYDSLVDIIGLKSMGGQQAFVTSSSIYGEDISITSCHSETRGAKMGTLMGVFIPCLQNILGIIFYIRFSWIVGLAGIAHSLLLVSLCCLCTFLTGLSLSAIATNGAMKGGGPYYLISRALGPEVGISIGLCFFLGNAIAGSLYILGAVETFLDAIPKAGMFGETASIIYAPSPTLAVSPTEVFSSPNLHDLQVYGVIITVVLCLVVFGGVKTINKVAPAFLVPVLLSVFLIFIGIFSASQRSNSFDINGLSLSTFKRNWGSNYQQTNRAGIPTPDGSVHWNF
ncbi:hypothetical protein KI387_026642, partial [Taxus chinensis]